MKHESNLHKALAELGMTQLDFANGGETFTTPLSELPAETLIKVLTYGKRIFNDAVNGAGHQGKDKAEAAKEWLERAKEGRLGSRSGGGGSRVSPLENEIRGIVEDYLKAAGWKAVDAKKTAKNPQEGFKAVLRGQLAKAKDQPESKIKQDMVEAAFAANWPKVETMAQQRLEITQGQLAIEL
jgi:hypothetical protein